MEMNYRLMQEHQRKLRTIAQRERLAHSAQIQKQQPAKSLRNRLGKAVIKLSEQIETRDG